GVKRLYSVPSFHIKVTHDDVVIEDEFVFGMVTNSRSVGGFRNMVGTNVVFDDGEFEVTLIKMPKNPLELNEIVAALLIELIDTKHMYNFKSGKVMFESEEEIPWTLDGEFGGEHKSIVIENKKQELQIKVCPDKIKSLMKDPELYIEQKEDSI
ncbi:MAG: diacylglycerol kinase family lipid kinase, partial [Lachnospiraceae bacterium]